MRKEENAIARPSSDISRIRLLKQSFEDSLAKWTISGIKRREASIIIQDYIKAKMALAEKHQWKLSMKMMKLNRKQATIFS
jgi:hypothetical protein